MSRQEIKEGRKCPVELNRYLIISSPKARSTKMKMKDRLQFRQLHNNNIYGVFNNEYAFIDVFKKNL